jgi:recombination associated protein RdgC
MINSFVAFQYRSDTDIDWDRVNREAETNPFQPTAPTSDESSGWQRPDPIDPMYVVSAGEFRLLSFMIETRTVPTDAIEAAVNERIRALGSDRPISRAVRRDMKEAARLELLPRAFPKQKRVLCLIDTLSKLIFVGTSSSDTADRVMLPLLVLLGEDTVIDRITCAKGVGSSMTNWVSTGEVDDCTDLSIGDKITIKRDDERKSVIRYKNYFASTNDVIENIRKAFTVASLSLTYKDNLAFTVSSDMRFSELELLEGLDISARESREPLHADLLIYGSACRDTTQSLITALGGIQEASS